MNNPWALGLDAAGNLYVAEPNNNCVRRISPGGIIKYLDLRRPIFRKTAAGGHFGRNDPDFTWESTHRAKELAQAAAGTVAAQA